MLSMLCDLHKSFLPSLLPLLQLIKLGRALYLEAVQLDS